MPIFPVENDLKEKILKCSEILESFGNAKTARNDNSSRFGKYTKIFIDLESYSILGAELVTYLLEKSRVVEPSVNERNYHIFYHLLYGSEAGLLDSLYLKPEPSLYKYLSISKFYKSEKINDKFLFMEMLKAFQVLNFREEEVNQIFKIIAAILLLGNLDFEENKQKKSNDDPPILIKNENNVFSNICSLLNCEKEKLERSLLCKAQYYKVEKQWYYSPYQMREVQINKNTFAKELYDKLFKWIVNKLNESLSNKNTNNNNYYNDKGFNGQSLSYIGLLDIFGFECFEKNGLEQFCINYTNEKLQQIFIVDVFKSDELEFRAEGLDEYLKEIKYSDNKAIIELMDNDDKAKLGVFQLLDDKCKMMAADDDNLFSEILKKHDKHEQFKYSKIKKNHFQIIHTAKTVEYEINGFIMKNKDKLEIPLLEIMQKIDLINWNMKESLEEDKDKFLGLKFRMDIAKLMKELNSCNRNYIRCLKSNDLKLPGVVAPSYVFNQIRYLGILDSIRIRKENFPKRTLFKDFFLKNKEFLELYKPSEGSSVKLELKSLRETMQLKDDDMYFVNGSKTILNEFFKDRKASECLIGRTKIYMMQKFNHRIESDLNKLIESKTKCINKIKHAYKRYRLAVNLFMTRVAMVGILLRRIAYQKKYKEMCKSKIRSTLKTAYFSNVLLEYKKNSVLRKIQYSIFLKKTKSFADRKKSFKVALNAFNFVFNNVIKTVKKDEFDRIIIEIIKAYYKFHLRRKALKAFNAVKKFKYVIKLENWLRIYLKRKVINNRISEYLMDDKGETELISFNTDVILYPHLANKKIEESEVLLSDNNYLNTISKQIETANNNNNNKNSKYKPIIPAFDYYGEPKIVLFAKVLNMDIIVSLLFCKYSSIPNIKKFIVEYF